ncbi:hypothetical protein VB773_09070 [Haloarculaceae archaeon H-GB2-1]|nr:hypothetical protein [Haloarculaceae archaeon H-GB2-1]
MSRIDVCGGGELDDPALAVRADEFEVPAVGAFRSERRPFAVEIERRVGEIADLHPDEGGRTDAEEGGCSLVSGDVGTVVVGDHHRVERAVEDGVELRLALGDTRRAATFETVVVADREPGDRSDRRDRTHGMEIVEERLRGGLLGDDGEAARDADDERAE